MRCTHRTSCRCRCCRITVSLLCATAPRCATGSPRRCAREAKPPLPCHLQHCGTWATLTSSACRRLAPAMGRTGCASRIALRCTHQLPTTSSPPPVLSFLPYLPLCARLPLFSPSRHGHGQPGRRHLPSISHAHVCTFMSVCQPSPPHLESSHDELQFGSSPYVMPLRPGPAMAEGSHPPLHPSSIHLHHKLCLCLHFTLRTSLAPLPPRRSH